MLNGILIGSLTSSVTSMSVPPPITLYGTKVITLCYVFIITIIIIIVKYLYRIALIENILVILAIMRKKAIDVKIIQVVPIVRCQMPRGSQLGMLFPFLLGCSNNQFISIPISSAKKQHDWLRYALILNSFRYINVLNAWLLYNCLNH